MHLSWNEIRVRALSFRSADPKSRPGLRVGFFFVHRGRKIDFFRQNTILFPINTNYTWYLFVINLKTVVRIVRPDPIHCFLKIPAHILCYLLGQTESRL